MTLRKTVAMAAALVVLLLATSAAADPVAFAAGEPFNLRIRSASMLTTDGGTVLRFPADARVLDPVSWDKLDTELRRLQDAETRLGAENASLRKSVQTASPVGWGTLTALVTGLAAGMVAGYLAFHK